MEKLNRCVNFIFSNFKDSNFNILKSLFRGDLLKYYGYEDEEIYTYCLQQDFVINSEEQITGTYRADGTQTYTRETNTNSEAIYDIDKEIQTIYRNNFYAYTFTNEEKISVN